MRRNALHACHTHLPPLLAERVQAYLSLDEQQQQEFQRLVATEGFVKVQAMNTTCY
jgi:hypothetical protein